MPGRAHTRDENWPHLLHPIDGSNVLNPGHGMVKNILKEQRLEIEEVIDTIHDIINQHRSDLKICLPELKESCWDSCKTTSITSLSRRVTN